MGRLEELSDSDAGRSDPGEGDREGRKVRRLRGHGLDCRTVLGKVQQGHRGVLSQGFLSEDSRVPRNELLLYPCCLGHWLGAACGRHGLHSNAVMESFSPWAQWSLRLPAVVELRGAYLPLPLKSIFLPLHYHAPWYTLGPLVIPITKEFLYFIQSNMTLNKTLQQHLGGSVS